MRVLLVEDEPDLGIAIKRTLSQESYIVDWAQDGQEALDYLNDKWAEYDLTIVDWMLPRLSGLEICKHLRKKGSSIPILMLTAKDQMSDKVTGLDAGADDYLVKPFGIEELLARLRALARRCPQYQTQELKVGKLILNYDTRTVHRPNFKEVALTTKEFQLLEYFMRNPERILTGEQLRNQLWEADSESVSNVVAAQMRLLRKKLATVGADGLIETLRGIGLMLYEKKPTFCPNSDEVSPMVFRSYGSYSEPTGMGSLSSHSPCPYCDDGKRIRSDRLYPP
jgi:DNA-binding response OmpR family regulator